MKHKNKKSRNTKKKSKLKSRFLTLSFNYQGLKYRMHITYNDRDGILSLIKEPGKVWITHSRPYMGKLLSKDVDEYFELFKRSALQHDAKAKIKAGSKRIS